MIYELRIKKTTLLNLVFLIELVSAGLVIAGALPRVVVLPLTLVLAIYVLLAPLEEAVILFIRSIPLFVAIPFTVSFDQLNMWRILSGLIFLKWLAQGDTLGNIWQGAKELFLRHRRFHRRHQVFTALVSLFMLACLSLFKAPSLTLGLKRLVYFVNLSLIGIVLYDLVRRSTTLRERAIRNIAVPVIIVTLAGFAQLISTYYLDIFQFVNYWGGRVELNLFGHTWSETAIKANTWFAYFGDQLSLRMFSIFPDSHSFPIFLLLGLPAILAVSLAKVVNKNTTSPKRMFRTRAGLLVVFVPLIFLALILSGTRGIWLAGAVSTAWAVVFILWRIFRHRKSKDFNIASQNLEIFKYTSSYLAIFFILFGVAYYIIASDQFKVSKENSALFGRRVRSVIDIAETSNARRLQIWRDSLRSIIKHPLLGVGIGNFPVVVGENLARAKAGSSAHNLYLHIAAELGLPALIAALWFLWLLLRKIYRNFFTQHQFGISQTGAGRVSTTQTIYYAGALIFIPWLLIYSLTDVAIFDERAFLLFAITTAIIFGQKENSIA